MTNKKYRFEVINEEDIAKKHGADFCRHLNEILKNYAENSFFGYDIEKMKNYMGYPNKPVIKIFDIENKEFNFEVQNFWYAVIRVKFINTLK